MATISLGNGADFLSAITPAPAFGNGSSVFGGNGKDTIVIGSGSPHDAAWRDLFVDGGNGDDSLSSSIRSSSGNCLDGGRGDDVLSSFTGPVPSLVHGDILTGGPGNDTFNFNTGPNFGSLRVTNDTNGVVSDGDTVRGNFAVVTDYTLDDRLVLGTTTAYEGLVALDPSGRMSFPGGYTTFRGEFDPQVATQFTVDPDGTDMLVVFDLPAIHPPEGTYGSVVLENYTQSDLTVVA